jgi:hypothetical protein
MLLANSLRSQGWAPISGYSCSGPLAYLISGLFHGLLCRAADSFACIKSLKESPESSQLSCRPDVVSLQET